MPAWLDFLSPYEFTPTVTVICGLALVFYIAGLVRLRGTSHHPGRARALAWFVGLGLIYGALQTHFDYWSQHIFFVHRIQHLLLHHLGPFLLAIAVSGHTLRAGMPAVLRTRVLDPLLANRVVRAIYRVIQQPLTASILFVGLIAIWLIPAIHFYAMLNVPLYNTMNWSMAVDGLLFWILMLDPRSPANGALHYGTRITGMVAVMFPQIVIGAFIGLTSDDLYPVYAVCGRIWPVTPAVDQQLGGLIIWIPSAMMSVVGVLVVLHYWMKHENPQRRAAVIDSPGVIHHA